MRQRRFKHVSVLLVLSMMLTLLPTLAVAAGGAVAKIDSTEYTSLKAAVDAATDGQTITLVDNVGQAAEPTTQIAEKIVVDKNITIDGLYNGNVHSINRTAGYLGSIFEVKAGKTLKLKDVNLDGGAKNLNMTYAVKTGNGYAGDMINVTYDPASLIGNASAIVNYGTLSMENVTMENFLSASNGSMINNEGDVHISKSTLANAWNTNNGANGGAIYSKGGSLTIADTIVKNVGTPHEGGFAILEKTALKVTGSHFERNFAKWNSGVFAMIDVTKAEVSGTTFNEVVVGNDGGITQYNGAKGVKVEKLEFVNCAFDKVIGLAQGNQSIGGVFLFQGANAIADNWTAEGKVSLENCKISNSSCYSGLVWNNNELVDIHIKGTTFENNGSTCLSMFNYIISDSTFKNNSGGIASVLQLGYGAAGSYDETKAVIKNTLIEGNKTTSDSGYGAIVVRRGHLTIGEGTVIRKNSGRGGAGVYVGKDAKTFIMEDGSRIYNNGASVSGDDLIINNEMKANGTYKTLRLAEPDKMSNVESDTYPIDGWYKDNQGSRFDAYTNANILSSQEIEAMTTGGGIFRIKAAAVFTDVKIKKEWTNTPNADSVKVNLIKNDETNPAKTVEVTKAEGWEKTVKMTKFDFKKGGEIEYKLTEESSPLYTGIVSGDYKTGFTVKNTAQVTSGPVTPPVVVTPITPTNPTVPPENPEKPETPEMPEVKPGDGEQDNSGKVAPNPGGENSVPKTGDSSDMMLYGLVAILSMAAAVAIRENSKKRNTK